MQFPPASGSNLERKKLALPRDFDGELNLVLIAFQQGQQAQVDTWAPLARQLEETHPALRYYELPTIRRVNVLGRTFINEGMRAGIPDPVARERTITLLLDKKEFREAPALPREDDIYVMLLDRQGAVFWRRKVTLRPDQVKPRLRLFENGPHDEDE